MGAAADWLSHHVALTADAADNAIAKARRLGVGDISASREAGFRLQQLLRLQNGPTTVTLSESIKSAIRK